MSTMSSYFHRHPLALTALLLAPPVAWLAVVYVGSLLALLAQSFYHLDDFSGVVLHEVTLDTYAELFEPANLQIILRTVVMAASVSIADALIAFPLAFYAARHARGWAKALFYIAVMMPLWSSYLVKVYAWKLILAKEGIISWVASALHLDGALQALLDVPVIGGSSLSFSYIGTFVVFTYVWLPYMVLPVQASVQRLPQECLEAAHDLGANSWDAFRRIVVPHSLPGLVAGSIFTFSLTLGDYIVPQIVGNSRAMIGQAVFTLQGTAGDIPLAAAFSVVPMIIMLIYLAIARRLGAFDAL